MTREAGALDSNAMTPVAEGQRATPETLADPLLPPGTKYCRCTVCGLYFRSDKGFMKHRITDQGARRCMTESEMSAVGMVTNERGYWITEAYGRETE